MATARDRKVWSQILNLYHTEYPYLWDKSHRWYSNQIMRNNAFKVLTQIYKDAFDDKDATVRSLKKKILNMRTTYFGELRKVRESLRSGSDEVYKPSLWYYDDLNFLADLYEPTNNNSRCLSTSDPLQTEIRVLPEDSMLNTSNKSESSDNELSPPQETKPNLKRPLFKTQRKITVVKKQEFPLNNSPRVFTTVTEDWEVFGRSIGLQLRDISREQLTIASKLISDTIYYAKLNRLTEDSRIDVAKASQYTIIGSKVDI